MRREFRLESWACLAISAAIHVSSLHKSYRRTIAVDGVSFDVQPGEIFGLIGPNGAGKTTTMECVEGLRRPDRGTIVVLGLDLGPGDEVVTTDLEHFGLTGPLAASGASLRIAKVRDAPVEEAGTKGWACTHRCSRAVRRPSLRARARAAFRTARRR